MAAIAPNTKVRILRNVPLDDTYEHTLWFDSKSAQQTYFERQEKYSWNAFTYQRVGRQEIRVSRSADDLYDCNYLMFQNSSFGDKWFYAFITAVEYINNECSQVSFELDVMQTWHFDYEFADTFVEREMATNEYIGSNIEPEAVALGEYVFEDYYKLTELLDGMAIVVAIVDTEQAADGKVYDGVFGGATLYAFHMQDAAQVNDLVGHYVESPDSVLGMWQCPGFLINQGAFASGTQIMEGLSGFTFSREFPAITPDDTLSGYKPKNLKMYTYPYNFFHVDNGNGSSLELRYELFDHDQPKLEVGGTFTQPVQVTCRPYNYKMYTIGGEKNTLNTEVLSLQGYPICSWAVDTYKAWVAQNSVPITIGIAGAAIGNLAAGNVIGAGESVFQKAIGVMQSEYKASIAADMSKGTFNNGSANVSMGKQNFFVGRCHVTRDMARVIDDYFTMFGYATNRLKKPNRNGRRHWNYVKTVGCNVHGSVPADDLRKICDVYDRGVTFWKNASEVGNYELDNS